MITARNIHFRTCDDVRADLQRSCATGKDNAEYVELGQSEAGRTIDAVVLGRGAQTVSLIAGAHSDEPVGPETLRFLILEILSRPGDFTDLLDKYKFVIVPHINPDGEAHNQGWINQWPDFTSYLQYVFREPPGRDLEFGFPDMRPENILVADLIRKYSPVGLHMSLHGMGAADGAMLLIERHWIDRTEDLRRQYTDLLKQAGLNLHDHDRGGEKGFNYIGPGFTTTPEGGAMRQYFESIKDQATAELFRDSSMEFVRSLGGGPLCLVTELPLFVIGKKVKPKPGKPVAYLEYKKKLPEVRNRVMKGESISDFIEQFEIEPVKIDTMVNLQIRTIEMGLETVEK